MDFYKYHALGNDYLVIDPAHIDIPMSQKNIRLICDRHFGVGSDGILWGPFIEGRKISLCIYNPDGSEAEKSGNGLRIFSRHLWDQGVVREQSFTVLTAGGKVKCQVHAGGSTVTVNMGRVSFDSRQIPVEGSPREVLNETIVVNSREFTFCAATIGNPHCVILGDVVSEEEARKWGPKIELDARFPNRTNVQFMRIIDRANIQIEIWERGAGYTLASGSSGCAAAAVAKRLGFCNSQIVVHMPGGKIDITVSKDFLVSMTGPVVKVAEGKISTQVFNQTS